MKKKVVFLSVCIFVTVLARAQPRQPKLVIGIIIDQMRYDYLYSFSHLYGNEGFARLLKNGQVFHDVHFNYIPTYTGPGHASVYTGTTPAVHGIAANDWFDVSTNKLVYCTDDASVTTVGNPTPEVSMSPANLLVPTVTDQFKSKPGNGKVIAVALKDRGAILPGGKKADAAYWFDAKTGNFITSTYYMQDLPKWVNDFNALKKWDDYLNSVWNLSLPVETYRKVQDETAFEKPFKGTGKAVFPYDLKEIRKINTNPGLISATPFGNSITLDFAREIIKNEKLGTDDTPDFISISFSSPDYIGHQFGPHSLELMDTYARIDRELAVFFKELDKNIGWENLFLFITSDHGAADVPGFSKTGGYYDISRYADFLGNKFEKEYGKNIILREENDQLYMDKNWILEKGISWEKIHADIISWTDEKWFLGAFIPDRNLNCDMPEEICSRIQRGFARGRSGDIWIIARPGWLPVHYEGGGTTHGSPYVYDTHAPLIFTGMGIAPSNRYERMSSTDIAPTVASFLGLPLPPGATGKPVQLKP
jgi:predicted AlkP superfamily pyrophosphatase or phosphodiesterase